MITTPVYATREDVKRATDVASTARYNSQIDRELDSASRLIDGQMRRVFYPTLATRTLDWLDHQYSLTWRAWLDANEMAAPPTQVLSGGVDITSGIMARPDTGPPYTRLEIDLSTDASFSATSTYQRAISVTGLFGYGAAETAGGSLAAVISTAGQTTTTVSNGALVGVGSIIRVDAERMIVTDKAMTDSGQASQQVLPQAANSTTVQVVDGSKFANEETIMVDSEKMRIDEITGNFLTVLRGWDGSTLAAHNANTEIYVNRQITVTRGALGTAAATHSLAAPINVHQVPGGIRTLCVAETLVRLGFERSGYVHAITRGEMSKVVPADDLWANAMATYQRKIRTRTAARFL